MSTLEAEGDRGQWELSKENIQPLKQGRKATVLSVALDENAQKKLALERQEFEKELRTYSGDDPLDIWYRYVVWVEQNYPKGGKDGNIKILIEKCVEAIQSSEQYLNDPRYLEIWIKYASISSVSLEIYQALDNKGIGFGLAAYYESYAWELEKIGSYKRADAIYQLGIQRLAKPIDQLEASHKKFQARVARSTIEGSIDQVMNSSEPQRTVFTALKTQGSKNRVANERVGSNVIGGAGRINVAKQSNVMGAKFQIFSDENINSGISCTSGSSSVSTVPGRSSTNKENDRNPSQWTKARASQKTTSVVNVEDLANVQKPAFSVHVDDNTTPSATPSKLCPNSNVLATRKNEYDDWHVPRFIAEPFDPTKQPQYPKNKVYCGAEEFSLEELRAANYFKKVDDAKKKEEEERKKNSELEAMQAALRQQEEMMKKQAEEMKQQKEMIQQLLQAQQLQQQQQQHQVSTVRSFRRKIPEKSTLYQDSFVQINKSVNFTVNQSHLLDDSTTRGLLQMQPATGCISSKESSVSLEPINSACPGSGPNSRDVSLMSSLHPGTSTSCSPTVNTKFAQNVINDMWNVSLFNNTQTNSAKDSESADPVVAPVSSAPFTIFCDENKKKDEPQKLSVPTTGAFEIFSDENAKPKPLELPAVQPFTIHSDELKKDTSDEVKNEMYVDENQENQAPAGFSQLKEKRQLSGILLPAINVEFCPLDQQKDECKETQEKESFKKESTTPEPKDDDMDGVTPLEDDITNFTINGGALADFTLKMPTRPEDFGNMAKMASTPGPWSLGIVPQGFKDGDDYTMAIHKIRQKSFDDDDACMAEDKSTEKEDKSGELMPPPPSIGPAPKTPTSGTKSGSSSPNAAAAAKGLSPIMEASREYRSSSTSSSSPGYSTTQSSHCTTHGLTQQGQTLSTTTMTKSRHLSSTMQPEGEMPMDIGGSNNCNYDISKSGYLADKSRGESLAESKRSNRMPRMSLMPVAASDFDPDAAAAMLCDMDEDMGLGNVGEISVMAPPTPLSAPPSIKNRARINITGPINPFSDSLLEQLLDNLDEPVEKRGGYCPTDGKLPTLKAGMQLRLGEELFHLKRTCGEGAYATVFHASTIDPMNVTIVTSFDDDDEDEKQMILKVQKPAFPWEFYICHELRQRLKAQSQPTIKLDAVMRINRGYFFSNGSILVNDYHKYGTLLNVINKYKVSGVTLPEELAILLIVEVLTVLEAVHQAEIIHADVKPDNFLILGPPKVNLSGTTAAEVFAECPSVVKIIDFGRSIDMKLLPLGTTFTEKVKTDGFTCCEMRDNREWTYQTDLYGVAAIAHCLLWGTYMNVIKDSRGKWNIKGTYKRYWNRNLWEKFFQTMLNVPSCQEIPDLGKIKETFMNAFMDRKTMDFQTMVCSKFESICRQKYGK